MELRKPSMKDRKEDLLKAYDELLEKYREKEKTAGMPGKEAARQKASEDTVVKKVAAYSVENIVKGLANLKLDLSKTLTELSDTLIGEVGKLKEIQDAIVIERKNLDEIYDIEVAAGTLANLIESNEEKKKAFEEEMAAAREQWRKEQEAHNLALKERDEKLLKERARESEEYLYNLKLQRKKEKDIYEEEKAALEKALKEKKEKQEKEFAEREAALSANENELAELRGKVANFPIELEKAIEKAKKEAAALTEQRAEQKADLFAKQVEGEKKVAELKIKTLEAAIKDQAAQIEALTRQLNKATAQVQDIAVKAIEGASGVKALHAVNEIALEQAKNVSGKQ